ncbi:hypothetical protein [Vibrio sp. EA2]|uniref:hypothetical protein n=1 Tax=Vibrio sp. EA2 TaxID=3079860 RepID=UPI0029495FCD|nr:hypothetical protein [Vibrio sp. EA2]MDV6252817.1 hypothetical protein [Vibrio sp. EA2]
MDNPKHYILVLVSLVALLLVLWLNASKTEKTVTAKVISNTLTKSLDGQRRYLTINSPETGQQRVSVPASASCPVGSTVTLSRATETTIEQSFSFVSCE